LSEMPSTEIVWIGRFTGPKGELAEHIIHHIAPAFPSTQFTMVGGPLTDQLRNNLPENVRLEGFVDNVESYLTGATAIIGAGRVAMEAMQAGKPVLAVGENTYHGWITEKNIKDAKATNFGDCSDYKKLDLTQFKRDIEQFISGEVSVDISRYDDFIADYSSETVYQSVMQTYRLAMVDQYLKRFKEIPILTYHRVVESPPDNSMVNMYVTVKDMEQQLLSLKKHGYQTVTFEDIANGVTARKPVLLTFDDGYEDNYLNLLPLLKKHKAKATIFALTNRNTLNNHWDVKMGEPEWPLMNNEQLVECSQSGCIEIGSHGVEHAHLSKLNDIQARDEIFNSKKHLEEILKKEVVSFAYPYGDYTDRESDLVSEAGYLFGIGTVNGPLNAATDRYRIRRITMFPNTSNSAFKKKTSGWYLRYCKFKGKDF